MSVEETKIIPWDQVDISNRFMFRLVMENKELCQTALERILNIHITKLNILEAEKSLEYKMSSKGVRLDIYAEDDKGICYDLEMQSSDKNKAFLGKRTRYYQSMLDGAVLKKGDTYEELKRSFVIFICKFDPFGQNYGCYTFNNWCDENKSIGLGDEATKLLLNTKGDKQGMSKELRDFLNFIDSGKPTDEYTNKLYNTVEVLKKDEGVRTMYMTWEREKIENFAEGKREGILEGRIEGKIEGKFETVCELILEKSLTLEAGAKKLGLSVEELEKLVADYSKKLETAQHTN